MSLKKKNASPATINLAFFFCSVRTIKVGDYSFNRIECNGVIPICPVSHRCVCVMAASILLQNSLKEGWQWHQSF